MYLTSGVHGVCVDTDCGNTDLFGGNCADINNCNGAYDTSDYVEGEMCCFCGGGVDEICEVEPSSSDNAWYWDDPGSA